MRARPPQSALRRCIGQLAIALAISTAVAPSRALAADSASRRPLDSRPLATRSENIRFAIPPTYPLFYVNEPGWADNPDDPLKVGTLEVGDVDGVDGADLVATGRDSAFLTLNHGDGTFGPAVGFELGLVIRCCALADLDGDGRLDLAAGGWDAAGPALVARTGLPDATFGPPQRLAMSVIPDALAAADLDADGRAELLAGSVAAHLVWVVGLEGATLAVRATVPVPGPTQSIAVADLDGDGRPDAVAVHVGGPNAPALSVLMNRASQLERTASIELPESPRGVTAVRSGVLGRLDLAVLTPTRVFSLRGRGDGTFDPPEVAIAFGAVKGHFRRVAETSSIASADFNRDGHADLMFGERDNGFWHERNYVVIAPGLAGGGFGRPTIYLMSSGADGLVVMDTEGDQAPDVAVLARGIFAALYLGDLPPPGVSVFRNAGDGRLGGIFEVGFGDSTQIDRVYAGGVEGARLRPGHPPDLVVAHGSRTFTLLNEGRNEFSRELPFGAGQIRAVQDLDGDGLDDVVLASLDSTRLYRSLGDGHLEPLAEYLGGVLIGLGDLDGDGMKDMALRKQDGTLIVRRGLGSASFSGPESGGLMFRHEATAWEVADVNGDGFADILSGLDLGDVDSLEISMNLGSGTWAAPASAALPKPELWSGEIPWIIATADMNLDGRTDVVVLNVYGTDTEGYLNVLIAQEDGSFQGSGPIDAGNDPHDLRVADMNLDGFPEILTIDSNGGLTFHFYVYENGGGHMLPYVRYRVGDVSSGIAVADLDGDSLPDVVTYTSRYNSVDIVRNISPLPHATPTLLSLVSCRLESGRVRLEWLGAPGVRSVSLERRDPASTWASLAELPVDAAGGVRYADGAVRPGARYGYRLTDSGGAVTPEAWIDVPATGLALRVRPNPVSRDAVITFALAAPAPVTLELLDLGGRQVRRQEISGLPAGESSVRLNAGARDLVPGVYWLRVIAGSETQSVRLSVMR